MYAVAASERSIHPRQPEAKVITTADLIEVDEGVYYSRVPIPLLDGKLIRLLKQAAGTSKLRRARFCAHPSPEAEQHDMLIVSHRDTYIAPHRHLSKSETFFLLEGAADIIVFDDDGGVEAIVRMGQPSSGKPFFYRMPPRKFHGLAIETELLVFLESTKGPFRLDDRENAVWAPDFSDVENGKVYVASVQNTARRL